MLPVSPQPPTHPPGWVSAAHPAPRLFVQGEVPDPAPAAFLPSPFPPPVAPKLHHESSDRRDGHGHGQRVGVLSKGLRAGNWHAGGFWTLTQAAQALHQKQGYCAKGGHGKGGVSNIQGEGWEMKCKEINRLNQNHTVQQNWRQHIPQPSCNTLHPSLGATSARYGRCGTITQRRAMAAFLVCRSSTYSVGNRLDLQSHCVLTITVPYSKIFSETFWHKQSTFHVGLSKLDIKNKKQSSYCYMEPYLYVQETYNTI